jgi:hypothetical protein
MYLAKGNMKRTLRGMLTQQRFSDTQGELCVSAVAFVKWTLIFLGLFFGQTLKQQLQNGGERFGLTCFCLIAK